MTWFETLTGFPEGNAKQVQEAMAVDGELLHSRINGQSWRFGRLDMPTLAELRQRATIR